MKKLFLLVLAMVLLANGCAPTLISYPPTAIDQQIVKGLEEFKLSLKVPEEPYRTALEEILRQGKNTVTVYQEKLFPIFNQMHQKYQKKNYDGTNVLIAKAKAYSAEWFESNLALKQAYEKLGEANKKMDGAVKTKTDEIIKLGKESTEKILNTINTAREFLDIIEGYDRARVEKNLSFLTKENEERFNTLSKILNQSGQELNTQERDLIKLLVELNELLNKGGG